MKTWDATATDGFLLWLFDNKPYMVEIYFKAEDEEVAVHYLSAFEPFEPLAQVWYDMSAHPSVESVQVEAMECSCRWHIVQESGRLVPCGKHGYTAIMDWAKERRAAIIAAKNPDA